MALQWIDVTPEAWQQQWRAWLEQRPDHLFGRVTTILRRIMGAVPTWSKIACETERVSGRV